MLVICNINTGTTLLLETIINKLNLKLILDFKLKMLQLNLTNISGPITQYIIN